MALISIVLLLRTAAHPSRLSSRAPGPLRPIPWVGQALRYMVSAPRRPILWVGQALGYMVSVPRRPIPVQCTAETDPVPRRPSPALIPRANTPNRSIVPVPHRLSPEHLPLTAGSPAASNTPMLSRGPRGTVVRHCRKNRICYPHPMGSVVPQIWPSRTLSSTL
jgi:hypothetical protein